MHGNPGGWLLLLLPLLGMAACLLPRAIRGVLSAVFLAVALEAVVAATLAGRVAFGGALFWGRRWFHLDALSAWHLAILMTVFVLSTLYGFLYFRHAAPLSSWQARRFGLLWLCALEAMVLVLVSNNLGIMWAGVEATTLATAFLICLPASKKSLEAMWKYLVVCSVGVAFAFLGTLLVAASTHRGHLESGEYLLWTWLRDAAPLLDPVYLKAGFLFLLVGYGTKAGLAPFHSWLPDAHSQAPAPVSALFSGFLLNTSLYCLLRYLPILDGCPGLAGWGRELLVLIGLISILVAAAFIVFQRDVKRLLAYSSVEHLGIIALGVGLGGWGIFAALFHMLNHSLGKTLSFFSAGRLGQIYGTHELNRMPGILRAAPVWGNGLFWGLLILIGVAPLAVFLSEFQILKAAADRAAWGPLALFLLGAGVVFVGALRHAIAVAWGKSDEVRPQPEQAGILDRLLVGFCLALLLALGLYMPDSLRAFLRAAAAVLGGVP